MPALKGSQTEANLKEAFAGESQANRRYLYFAQKADVEGYPDVAALFRSVAEGETGHAFGHFDFLKEVGDPVTGVPVGPTEDNLKSAIEGETYEYTEMYPGFAKTARDEGFEEIGEWLETLAKAEKSHAGRFTQGLESLSPRTGRMTATYDPTDPKYFDPAALRVELDRVFDLCHGCRLCFNLCPSFPTMFKFIDEHDGDVGALSDAQHDRVVDECYQCKLCYVKCPYVPPHEWKLDFPRLMSRVHAVRKKEGVPVKERLTDQFLGRTDALGKVSVASAPVVNWATGTPGSFPRKVMEKTVGLASERLLPPYARQRFTTWFKKRKRPSAVAEKVGAVSVFPTCFVEYMDPDVGKDVVRVYEHNGVECSVPAGTQCCGAPWLHSGNLDQFEKAARRNVSALAAEVRAGRDVVVSQPTCAYIVKKDYPLYVGSEDAALVAAHTYDPAEYLIKRQKDGADDFALREEFPGRESGSVPEAVTYHVACHLQAQNIGLKSRDLLKVAGVKCSLVQRCSGIDGTWGYRAENYDLARKVAAPLAREIEAAGNEVVCGDCHLANGAILQETGTKPMHPMQLMARAYGLSEES